MMVALAVPEMVMRPPCHVETGPSLMGGAHVPVEPDGAAQPACDSSRPAAALMDFSLRSGFAMPAI